jgi:hypothetical protein
MWPMDYTWQHVRTVRQREALHQLAECSLTPDEQHFPLAPLLDCPAAHGCNPPSKRFSEGNAGPNFRVVENAGGAKPDN